MRVEISNAAFGVAEPVVKIGKSQVKYENTKHPTETQL